MKSSFLLLLLPLAAPLDVFSPTQQEFEALVTLSKGGLLDLDNLELEGNVDVSGVPEDDLARLLSSCKDGFELSGVVLTEGQWKALVERSRVDDLWNPKYLSIEDFSELQLEQYLGWESQWSLQELFSNTETVYLSELDLGAHGWQDSPRVPSGNLRKKCQWLEVWYTGSNGEDICEGHGFNPTQCQAVGCCHWDDGQCWSSVGHGPCGSGRKMSDFSFFGRLMKNGNNPGPYRWRLARHEFNDGDGVFRMLA